MHIWLLEWGKVLRGWNATRANIIRYYAKRRANFMVIILRLLIWKLCQN